MLQRCVTGAETQDFASLHVPLPVSLPVMKQE